MVSTSFDGNIVDEIKSRCNIVDVIGHVVALKKAGNNHKGVCPFHNEKTPSFVVSEPKQIFTCFGCGATGDVIEFVKRYNNLEFGAAVEKLADEYGIEIKNAFHKTAQKDELYEINRVAAKFFYQAFANPANPARAYMQKRGFDQATLKKFGVGYADSEWDSLYTHFKALGTDEKKLLELGLISESKGKYYDKFRERVIFPIINTNGKIIGFGGRVLGDGVPKYLNSAESPVFLKKNNLFGLNLTRQDISKENRAILVEGYMDVMALYQAGIRNVSASLGTALTENQAKILKRYTPNVILAYDADEAGIAAAIRGLDILYREGCKARVLHISDGKDPDEFVKKNGKAAFVKLIDDAMPYIDYRLSMIQKNYDLTSTEGKIDYIKEAVTVLKRLSPVEAEAYIKIIAKDTKISESAIRLEYNGNNIQIRENHEFVGSTGIERAEGNQPGPLEKNFIKLILIKSSFYEKVKPYESAFVTTVGKNIFAAIKNLYAEGEEIDIKKLADSLEAKDNKALEDILENVHLADQEEKVFLESVNRLEFDALNKREKELILRLSMADETENKEGVDKLTIELMTIQQEIQVKKVLTGGKQ